METKCKEVPVVLLLVLIQGVLVSDAVEIRPSHNPAVAGDTLVLSLSPPSALTSASWVVGESGILSLVEGEQIVFPNYKGRASVNVLTGALTLSPVTVGDSGVFELQSSNPPLTASVSIGVLEPISNVSIETNSTVLIESTSSAVVRCTASGTSVSFLWQNRSAEVTAGERIELSNANATLTIANVSRHDQGPFRCRASNAVSNSTSDSLNLTISYGPDNMVLTVNGENATSFPAGSNLTMLCSAQSNPPAQLQWAFEGELLNATGPQLELRGVRDDQSGRYSCLAINNHTSLSSNITKHILINKAGSKHQTVSVRLLLVLLLLGYQFCLPDVGGSPGP